MARDTGGSVTEEARDVIRFRASLPPILSAITLDGNGDGARIKLDIPRSDIAAILLLQRWAEALLEVTIRKL